ncbi:hypothetical protein [Spiroplasma tabanidicola]|uniref:Transmembrane protein n=1 Tax=Spiroplasma tabanidicola TaxID=324079 RepID=A0A6I6C5S0_9MOLU|nr:hypothetical protein [Spiroplasma tabanidicola]QGS52227.1 hypothetical protein STABA_v1c08720 [Spiroplasma tabanidicola]
MEIFEVVLLVINLFFLVDIRDIFNNDEKKINKRYFNQYLKTGFLYIFIIIITLTAALLLQLSFEKKYSYCADIPGYICATFGFIIYLEQIAFSIGCTYLYKKIRKDSKSKALRTFYIMFIVLTPVLGYFLNIIFYSTMKNKAELEGYTYQSWLKNKKSRINQKKFGFESANQEKL